MDTLTFITTVIRGLPFSESAVMTTQKVRGFCVKNLRFKSSYHPCEVPFSLPAVLHSTEALIQHSTEAPILHFSEAPIQGRQQRREKPVATDPSH